jgi:hypothetical protein
MTNRRHQNLVIGNIFFDNFEDYLRRLVWMTDGHLVEDCLTMASLHTYRELGIDVLLRGHGGEILHIDKAYSYSVDRSIPTAKAGLEPWLFKRLCLTEPYRFDGLFSKGVMMSQLARESLNQCLVESDDFDLPESRVTHLFFTQRLRRKTAVSMRLFADNMNVRLPYLDKEVLTCALKLPPALRTGDRVQAHILDNILPAFNKVPNTNTGARLGASWVEQRFAALRSRIGANLNLKGYHPYQRMRVWMQGPLHPLINRILLSDQFADRGICNPQGLKTVIRDHCENRADHTWLLLALMTLELGQQQLSQSEANQAAILEKFDRTHVLKRFGFTSTELQ